MCIRDRCGQIRFSAWSGAEVSGVRWRRERCRRTSQSGTGGGALLRKFVWTGTTAAEISPFARLVCYLGAAVVSDSHLLDVCNLHITKPSAAKLCYCSIVCQRAQYLRSSAYFDCFPIVSLSENYIDHVRCTDPSNLNLHKHSTWQFMT